MILCFDAGGFSLSAERDRGRSVATVAGAANGPKVIVTTDDMLVLVHGYLYFMAKAHELYKNYM